MKKIVILLSGRGSNMQAIAAACAAEAWPARVSAVISDREGVPGIAAARAAGIPASVVPKSAYDTREAFDAALAACIDAYAPDVVVLAGFMRILGPWFVTHYAGRLLNIHPSLLPSFPGANTHGRVLASGAVVHGATVHFVSAELDAGPIVAQAVVPVEAGDDATTLAARVQRCEHFIYPRAIKWFIEGRLSIVDQRVVARLDAGDSRWHFATERA